MIAITGANGNLGKAILSYLLQSADQSTIVAVARDTSELQDYSSAGIHIRQGDYEDPHSLETAFEGCDTVMQISSSAYGEPADKHEQNVVTAAVNASVQRIVYTSTLNPGIDKHFMAAATCGATEDAIRNTGLRYSFFRNSMYHETVPLFVGSALEDGKIFYPASTGCISFVSRLDIAEALAKELLAERNESKVFQITGPQALGFDEIAGLLRSEKGLPGEYTDIPNQTFGEILEEMGVPANEIAFYTSMADGIRANEFTLVSDDLENLLGRKRCTLKEFLRNI